VDLKDIRETVEQATTDGVVTWRDARAPAEKLGVDYSLVGQACDEAG